MDKTIQIDTFTRFTQVSRETITSLKIYEDILIRANKTLNLVGKSTIKSSLEKHPESYDDAGKNLGLGPLKLFQKIHLPINKFALITAFIVTFIDLMKELPITLILSPFNFDTLATQTYEFAVEEMIPLSSIYSFMIIFICSILLIFLKNFLDKSDVFRS